MKFFVKSFGCRTNQAELQKWIRNLESRGYRYSSEEKNCRFGIYNTCSLTQKAEGKTCRNLKKHHQQYPDVPCVVTGCTVTRRERKLREEFPDYIFLPNSQKPHLIDSILKYFPNSSNLIFSSIYRSRYFLKIQDGCNFRCSYCVIPSLRGKSRSIPMQTLVAEAKTAAQLGYREVVLTGINLTSYGNELDPRENLLDVIEEISRLDLIRRIRISSLDPRMVNFSFIKKLRGFPKVAQNFHLSFQSGSNRVLRDMKRYLKRSDYFRIMKDFTGFFPRANFGADFIVGFPGEEDRDFMDTMDLARNSGLNYLHIFPFSPMEGTKAFFYSPVSNHIIMKRVRQMRDLNQRLKISYRERMRDTCWDAVVVQERSSGCFVLTDNYLRVRIDRLPGLKKRLIRVKVKGIIDESTCQGEWV